MSRAKIERLSRSLEILGARENAAAEAYNGSRYRLGVAEAGIQTNTRRLGKATADQHTAQTRLSGRISAIYRNPAPNAVTALLAGRVSITDVTSLEGVFGRVASQDASAAIQVRRARDEIRRSRRALIRDRRSAGRQVVAARTRRREIAAVLGERRRLLEHERGTLAALQASERKRQAAIAAAARTRVAEELRASQLAAQQTPVAVQPQSGTPDETPSSDSGQLQSPPPSTASPATLGGGGAGRPDVVAYAMKFLGVPYVWGGATPGGFDCSGLTQYVYAKFGISMIHYTGSQWSAFPHVAQSDLQPGDLVFFHNLGHEGMYIGNGQFIHAPHTGDVVKISNMSDPWYASGYEGAVRPY